MVETNSKYFNVNDFASLYYNKEMIDVFRQQVKFSNSWHEGYVIFKMCYEERVNMIALDGSPIPYFYLHLYIMKYIFIFLFDCLGWFKKIYLF